MPKKVPYVGYFGLRRALFSVASPHSVASLRYLASACSTALPCLLAALWLCAGCGPVRPKAVEPQTETSASESPEPTSPELSLDQLAQRERLVRHAEVLSKKIGERNAVKDWELAEASDYVSSEWEKMGLAVEHAGFVFEGRTYSNLSVVFEGSEHPDEVILVMAGYDSPLGSSGVNSALTTAVLLELGRHLSHTRYERTVRLWALAMSEHVPDGAMSSLARVAGERASSPNGSLLPVPQRVFREKFELALQLRNLGGPVQRRPAARQVQLQYVGEEAAYRSYFLEGLEGDGIELTEGVGPVGAAGSTHLEAELGPFLQGRVPVLRLAGGSAPALDDADFTAILSSRLPFALGRAAREVVINDGMLTPPAPKAR